MFQGVWKFLNFKINFGGFIHSNFLWKTSFP